MHRMSTPHTKQAVKRQEEMDAQNVIVTCDLAIVDNTDELAAVQESDAQIIAYANAS